jgi:hypothetical protein
MGVDSIRQIIAAAKQHEQRTQSLQRHFEHRLDQLGRQLLLPEERPVEALVEFVEHYIDYVPEFIESVMSRSREYGLHKSVAPFIHMAEDFFLAPPEELGDNPDLLSLLDEAFLAQRLIEEVNDHHIQLYRTPLLPVDMTRANIIVHHLIGDALANRLDGLVQQSVSILVDHNHLFGEFGQEPSRETSLLAMWQGLPCLSRVTSVDLRLGGGAQSSS